MFQEFLQGTLWITLLAAACLIGYFLCSMTEAALYSISRARIETLRRRGDRRGQILAELRERIDEPIVAILILNTLLSTAGAIWIGALVAERYGNDIVGVFSAVFTVMTLFLSEIVPKSIGFKFANRLAPVLAWPLRILIFLLWPLVRLSVMLTSSFGRNVRIAAVTKEDLISLAGLSERSGSILSQEAHWIANALQLDKIHARDIMTPASVVRLVSAEMPLSLVRPDAEHWRFSRLPVCRDDDPKHIVGVVQRREVFNYLAQGKKDLRIRHLMALPIFVYEDTPGHELLNKFIQHRTHLFCVQDKQGGFLGIVTLEDVLEALLGAEIVGEQDPYEDMQQLALQMEQAKILQELGQSGGVLLQVVVSPKSPSIGKKIQDLTLPRQVLIGTVLRGKKLVVPHGDFVFQMGDRISLIGEQKDIEQAKKKINPLPE